jgi:hypothetical protein
VERCTGRIRRHKQDGNETFGRKESRLSRTLEVRRGRTGFRALANEVLLLSFATRMSGKRTETLENGQNGSSETPIKCSSI